MASNEDPVEFRNIDITDPQYVDEESRFLHRRTLIAVTVADPLIQQVDIQKMMEMGMNVLKLKTSHLSRTDKVHIIHKVDKATKYLARKHGILEWPCAICIELKTNKVQTGLLQEDIQQIYIKTDSEIILTTEKEQYDKCNERNIFIDYPNLTVDVRVGMEINIDQDEITMVCTAKDEQTVTCTVTKGGYLRNMSYVCMRGAKRSQPILTKKDYQLIQFAMEYRVDILEINYPQNIETIVKVQKFLRFHQQKKPLIFVGISTEEELKNIDDFVQNCDGVILPREFLPFEIQKSMYYRMGQIQSYIAGKCRQVGTPFYISGDIFQEALLTGVLCCREISDVTNALLAWTSGFVLSEYRKLNYLYDVMKMIDHLCCSVEPVCGNKKDFWQKVQQVKMPLNAAEACAVSCAVVANQTNARLIIIPTVSGRTATVLNSMQPNSIIMAVSTKIRSLRLLKSFRSVEPLLYKGPPHRLWFNTVQARVRFALKHAVINKWISSGEYYVSLEKATEESSFCDAVRVWVTTDQDTNTNRMDCPESYYDFNINSYVEPEVVIKKRKVTEVIEVTETVETEKDGEETEIAEENAEDTDEDNIIDESERKKSEFKETEHKNSAHKQHEEVKHEIEVVKGVKEEKGKEKGN